MRKTIGILVLVLFSALCGCASWQNRAFYDVQDEYDLSGNLPREEAAIFEERLSNHPLGQSSCIFNVEIAGSADEDCDNSSASARLFEAIRNCHEDAALLVCLPEHEAIAHALLDPSVVTFMVRVFDARNGILDNIAEMRVWYSVGELHVRSTGVLPNYSTVDGQLYEWSTGASQGTMLSRSCGDTTRFLFYLADLGEFKAVAYRSYVRAPQLYERHALSGGFEILPKDKDRAWIGVRHEVDPFWLRSFVFWDVGVDADYRVIDIPRPTTLRKIPEELRITPAIAFKQSSDTILSRIEHL